MADWITTLRKLKLELREQDTTTLSDEAVASKVLRGSGLSYKEQYQILPHAGGQHASEPIEAVLKSMYGKHHEGERKLGHGHQWRAGLRPAASSV